MEPPLIVGSETKALMPHKFWSLQSHTAVLLKAP